MKKLPLIFLLIVLIINAGCDKSNGNQSEEEELPMENIAYGSHVRQVMDISLPSFADEKNEVPVILCIHGGSWSGGDKKDFDYMKANISNYNCAYVTLNYRLVQDGAIYKDMIEDIRLAVNYLKNNGKKYHLKTDKLAIIGSSAGGHLGLLYAYAMNSPIKVACLSSQVGPTDFMDPGQIALNGNEMFTLMNLFLNTNITPADVTQDGFEFPASWYDASPIHHVNSNSPPTVLAYGMKDELVSYTNATKLNDTLQAHGVDHRLILYPNSGHGLNNDLDKSTEYMQTLVSFLNTYLLQ